MNAHRNLVAILATAAFIASQIPFSRAQNIPPENTRLIPRHVFDGDVVSVGRNQLDLLTCRLDGAVGPQQFLVPDKTPITLDGRSIDLGALRGGHLARIQGRTAGDLLVADTIDAVTPQAAGSRSRTVAPVVFAAGGGGGNGGLSGSGSPGTDGTDGTDGITPPVPTLPDINLPDINIPDINLPDITVNTPDVNVDLPDIVVILPDVNVDLPDVTVNLPDVTVQIPDLHKPGTDLPDPDEIHAVLEAVLNEIPDAKHKILDQLESATEVVTDLKGDAHAKLHHIAVLVAPRIDHLANIIDVTVMAGKDAVDHKTALLYGELSSELHTVAGILRQIAESGADQAGGLKGELLTHLQACAATARELASGTADHAIGSTRSVLVRLADSLQATCDHLTVLVDTTADKVDAAEGAVVQTILGLGGICDSVVADIVSHAEHGYYKAARQLRYTATVLEATLINTTDRVKSSKAQLIQHLRDTANAVELLACVHQVVGDAADRKAQLIAHAADCLHAVVVDLEALTGEIAANVKGTLHEAGSETADAVHAARHLLIVKLRHAADAVAALKDGSAGTIEEKKARLARTLADACRLTDAIIHDARDHLVAVKQQVAEKLEHLAAGTTGQIDAELTSQIAGLIRIDTELDADLAARLADSLMAGAILDGDAMTRIARIIAVDVDTDALLDASLLHQLLTSGSIDADLAVRLIPIVMVNESLSAQARIRLVHILHGDIVPDPAVDLNLRSQLTGAVLVRIDRDTPPLRKLSRLLHGTAGAIRNSLADAPDRVLELKQRTADKLEAAAETAGELAELTRGHLEYLADGAGSEIVALKTELADRVSDALTDCDSLASELGDTVEGVAARKLATVLVILHTSTSELKSATGDAVAAAGAKLHHTIEEAAFQAGLLKFMLLERTATVKDHLAVKLHHLASTLEDSVTGLHGTVAGVKAKTRDAADDATRLASHAVADAKLLLAAKLRHVAQAVIELKYAMIQKTGETTEQVIARVAAAKQHLADALRDCAVSADQLVAVLKAKAHGAEALLAAALHSAHDTVADTKATLIEKIDHTADAGRDVIDGKVTAARDILARKLAYVAVTAETLVASIHSHTQDVKGRLAGNLRHAADTLDSRVDQTTDGVRQKAEAAKSLLVAKLRFAADAADQLLYSAHTQVGETREYLASRRTEAVRKLSHALAEASEAARNYCDAIQAKVGSVEDRLAVVLHNAADAAAGLHTVIAGKVDHVSDTAAHAGHQAQILADRLLCHCLEDSITAAAELAASVTGRIPDAHEHLAATLHQAADRLDTALNHAGDGLTTVQQKAHAAKRHLVRTLRHAAVSAHELANAVKSGAGEKLENTTETVFDAKRALIIAAQAKLAWTLHSVRDAAEDCLPDASGIVTRKLAVVMHEISQAVAGLKYTGGELVAETRSVLEQKVAGLHDHLEGAIAVIHGKVNRLTSLHVLLLSEGTLNTEARAVLARVILASAELNASERIALARRVLAGDVSLDAAASETIRHILNAEVDATLDQSTRIASTLQEATGLDATAHADVLRILTADALLDVETQALVSRAISGEAALDATVRVALRRVAEAQATVSTAAPQIEVLLSGPVHEAFLQPFDGNVTPGQVIHQAPPLPLHEIAPRFMPEGNGIQWIPGYWSTLPDAKGINDFVWVSGTFRRVPPGRTWMSGGWVKVADGFRWTPGAWVPADFNLAKAQTVSVPPSLGNLAPVGTAPSALHTWVPPQQLFENGKWVARDGFWTRGHSDWVWNPARLIPTATGTLRIDGFWDHRITERGQLFAPVRITNIADIGSHAVFSPGVIVHADRMVLHLFAHPASHHYLFGNFYEQTYSDLGIVPWFSPAGKLGGFDPILHRESRVVGQSHTAVIARLQSWHRYFAGNIQARPPRTVSEFAAFIKANQDNRFAIRSVLASNLQDVIGSNHLIDRLADTGTTKVTGLKIASGLVVPGAVNSTSLEPGIGSTLPHVGSEGILQTSGTLGTFSTTLTNPGTAGGLGTLPGSIGSIPGGGLNLPSAGSLPGAGFGSLPSVGTLPGSGVGNLPGIGGSALSGPGGAAIGSPGGTGGLPGGPGAGGLLSTPGAGGGSPGLIGGATGAVGGALPGVTGP